MTPPPEAYQHVALHFIPVDRLCQIFEDIFGISLSPGTCANVDEKLFQKLESFESSLKTYLLAARVLHFDETGMRCEKKLHWVHVASSQVATLYTIHPKRGKEAMDTADILPEFKGIAVHDHWFPYFSYEQIIHALCNTHHLRELTFVHEQEKKDWAKGMKDLLILGNLSHRSQNYEDSNKVIRAFGGDKVAKSLTLRKDGSGSKLSMIESPFSKF